MKYDYKVSSMYLHIQEVSDGCWDYTLYDNQLREIDGGQLGDPDTPLSEVRDDLIFDILHGDKKPVTEIPMEQFEQMMDEKEHNLKCPSSPNPCRKFTALRRWIPGVSAIRQTTLAKYNLIKSTVLPTMTAGSRNSCGK